jgi:hypothetical protein
MGGQRHGFELLGRALHFRRGHQGLCGQRPRGGGYGFDSYLTTDHSVVVVSRGPFLLDNVGQGTAVGTLDANAGVQADTGTVDSPSGPPETGVLARRCFGCCLPWPPAWHVRHCGCDGAGEWIEEG